MTILGGPQQNLFLQGSCPTVTMGTAAPDLRIALMQQRNTFTICLSKYFLDAILQFRSASSGIEVRGML